MEQVDPPAGRGQKTVFSRRDMREQSRLAGLEGVPCWYWLSVLAFFFRCSSAFRSAPNLIVWLRLRVGWPRRRREASTSLMECNDHSAPGCELR